MDPTIADYLLGLLTIAFTSWASVVYRLGVKALDKLDSINMRLAVVEEQNRKAQARFDSHEKKPWHDEAGTHLASIESDIKHLADNMERNRD